LFAFDDDAADFPGRADHGCVDRLPGPVPGCGDSLFSPPVE
jgi:hypothetical protein